MLKSRALVVMAKLYISSATWSDAQLGIFVGLLGNILPATSLGTPVGQHLMAAQPHLTLGCRLFYLLPSWASLSAQSCIPLR